MLCLIVLPWGGVVKPHVGVIAVEENLVIMHLKTNLTLLLFLFFLLL